MLNWKESCQINYVTIRDISHTALKMDVQNVVKPVYRIIQNNSSKDQRDEGLKILSNPTRIFSKL